MQHETLQGKNFAEVRPTMTKEQLEQKLARALELVGPIDPEIEESWSRIEERILAQALENVELAERHLREIQDLVGERVLVESAS
jgi:hypothetical protein